MGNSFTFRSCGRRRSRHTPGAKRAHLKPWPPTRGLQQQTHAARISNTDSNNNKKKKNNNNNDDNSNNKNSNKNDNNNSSNNIIIIIIIKDLFKKGEGTADRDTVASSCSTGNRLSKLSKRTSSKNYNWKLWARWGFPTVSSPIPIACFVSLCWCVYVSTSHKECVSWTLKHYVTGIIRYACINIDRVSHRHREYRSSVFIPWLW